MKEVLIIDKEDFTALMDRLDKLERRLEMAEQNTVEWVNVKEAGRILNVCKNTVYALVKRGEIERSQDGKNIAISTKSIRSYREKYTVPTN